MSQSASPELGPSPQEAPKRPRSVLTALLLLAGGVAAWVAFDAPGTQTLVNAIPAIGKFAGVARGAQDAKPQPAASGPAQAAQGRPGGGGRPSVAIFAAEAQKMPVQVRFDGLGTVQPVAQVSLRSRFDSQIETVNVQDGAIVKAGDLLFTLDSRQLLAQFKQAEAAMSRNRATLEGAKRDMERVQALYNRDVSARKLLDDARTKVDELTAQTRADEATVDNLKVQLSYAEIRAPISGRFGMAGLKAGAIVRQGEATTVLGSIVQTAPIYVAFGVPQRLLGELRTAMVTGKPQVNVSGAGLSKPSHGEVAFLDNAIDQSTGMIMARALVENADDNLWPGALVNIRLIIREEERIVVPTQAILSGQNGTYAFVIKDNAAQMRSVEIDRTQDGTAIVTKGLAAGETVATDGQMMLSNGTPVSIRKPQPAQKPAS